VPFAKSLDVIQQAQSGTGKTATFCAGILQNLDYNQVECQALVLAPTRELAQQIEKVMRALGDYLQVGGPSSSGASATSLLQLGVGLSGLTVCAMSIRCAKLWWERKPQLRCSCHSHSGRLQIAAGLCSI